MKKQVLGLFIFGLCFASSAHALKFTNQFVEFELPYKWNCSLEGAEWVCQSQDEQKRRDAIIVLAAKLKGDQDTLDKYQEYLMKPRAFAAPNGKSVTSQPKYTEVKQLNQHPWVVSLHLESEIPGFYTRYLATVKQDIGVLVTYSINKNKYQEYSTQFEDMVKSLKVFRKPGSGINTNVGQSIFAQAQMPGSFTQQSVFGEASPSPASTAAGTKPKNDGGDDNLGMLALLGAVVVAFIIIKKRRRGA
ncbi:MAG: hypothetical protein AB1540_09615 [Bdellovibrionota bacterium]